MTREIPTLPNDVARCDNQECPASGDCARFRDRMSSHGPDAQLCVAIFDPAGEPRCDAFIPLEVLDVS